MQLVKSQIGNLVSMDCIGGGLSSIPIPVTYLHRDYYLTTAALSIISLLLH